MQEEEYKTWLRKIKIQEKQLCTRLYGCVSQTLLESIEADYKDVTYEIDVMLVDLLIDIEDKDENGEEHQALSKKFVSLEEIKANILKILDLKRKLLSNRNKNTPAMSLQ